MSFKPEVQADSSGKWYPNALCFATRGEALDNVADLWMRWMAVRATRVVESSDPVTHVWRDGQLLTLAEDEAAAEAHSESLES